MGMFQPATKQDAKLKMAIAGPPGGGKTYTALEIAKHLVPGGKIAFADTEHKSSKKYADVFKFDVAYIDPPYHPDRFISTISGAVMDGYDVLVVDSLSHAWNGRGGLLELVDQFAGRSSNNSFTAWKDATPIHHRLIESILSANIHVICTMRSKMEYVIEENDRGKKVPRKIGLAPVQREGTEYEFDIFAEMDVEHRMTITKTRCSSIANAVFERPGRELAEVLRDWLTGDPIEMATDEQVQTIRTLANLHGFGKKWLLDNYHVARPEDLPAKEADRLIDWLEAKTQPPPKTETEPAPAPNGTLYPPAAEQATQAELDAQRN